MNDSRKYNAMTVAQHDEFMAWVQTPQARQVFHDWAARLTVESPETACHAANGDAVVSMVDPAARITKAGQ